MKRKKWILLVLIAACLALFLGYRAWQNIRTDTKPPVLSFNSSILELSVQEPQEALLQGVTAWDDTAGDVTATVVVEQIRMTDDSGLAAVIYAAFDSVGNVSKAMRQVQFTDYHGPRFSLTAPALLTPQSNGDLLPYLTATDVLDGDISHRVRLTPLSANPLNEEGTHDLLLQVTNSLGHTAEMVLPLKVRPTGDAEGQLRLSSYLVYLNQGDAFRAEDYLSSFTLDMETISLGGKLPKQFSLQTSGTVDITTPGVYPVDYQLTYRSESESYTAVSRLIVVVEE